jgi:hypothetical protein
VRVAEDLDLGKLERTDASKPSADPFAARSFSPPAQATPAPREKPTAPPLPFRYIGKLLDEGRLAVFLQRGGESFSVAAGDTIGEYRVDAITDAAITFTYLPLKTKQTLPL